MTDPRPAPQYGEYATPEQQAAAMGKTYAPPPPVVAPDRTIPPPVPGTQVQQGANRTDVFVSALLIAVGLYNVISQLFVPTDYPSAIDAMYKAYGISGTFQVTDLVSVLSKVVTVAYIVIFLLVVLLTFARLRRGRIAWWIPLLGGIVASLVASSCVFALILSDPAFTAYLAKFGG